MRSNPHHWPQPRLDPASAFLCADIASLADNASPLWKSYLTAGERTDSRFAGEVLRKIDQAAADWALLKTGAVNSVVWFGQHPLPTTGLGGQLKRTLEAAGILYYVVKP